ncbi:hypothetical protein SteCoe_18080 [Stentor coeruleus]|uniref:Rhodanese domain-containing protein n=1 Tax=Stentor coeruleus TaxID=5963 RepID=A0A1R2BXB7_9CILI|nr:hypothetical protein SteCoe_18080 [Stentor coeruleus]
MMPFMSIDEYISSPSSISIYCKDQKSQYIYTIPGSIMFIIPESNDQFISKIQRLSLSETDTIVCYDKGELINAGKVFWALKAVGFNNIHILLGGVVLYHDLGHQVNEDSIEEAILNEQYYKAFNNSILKVIIEPKTKAYYQQRLRADEDLPITTPRGTILTDDILKEVLENSNLLYKSGKNVQVIGKYAPIIGCVLLHLGEKMVCVVLESEKTNNEYFWADENSIESLSASLVHNDTSYMSSSMNVIKKSNNREGGASCSKCCVF